MLRTKFMMGITSIVQSNPEVILLEISGMEVVNDRLEVIIRINKERGKDGIPDTRKREKEVMKDFKKSLQYQNKVSYIITSLNTEQQK